MLKHVGCNFLHQKVGRGKTPTYCIKFLSILISRYLNYSPTASAQSRQIPFELSSRYFQQREHFSPFALTTQT